MERASNDDVVTRFDRSARRYYDTEGGELERLKNAISEIENVIHLILDYFSRSSSHESKRTVTKAHYLFGYDLSELLLRNPQLFREIIEDSYGYLSDDIIESIVTYLMELTDIREKPPPIDSLEFKIYIKKLAEELERKIREQHRKSRF